MKQLMLILLVMVSEAQAQESVKLNVLFSKDSDVPYMPGMAMLNDVAQYPDADQLRFSVVGLAGSIGSASESELAKSRTMIVVRHLLLSGIRPYNIIFDHHGAGPLTDVPDTVLQNGLVQVLITSMGPIQEGGFGGSYPVNRPLAGIGPEPETFVIDNAIPECIETADGTMIDVPAMAFMDAYGRPVAGTVKLTFSQYSDPVEVFQSGIRLDNSTADENTFRETAGIFSIEASYRGRPVALRNDRKLHVDLLSASTAGGFMLSYLDPANGLWRKIAEADVDREDADLCATVLNMPSAVTRYLQKTDFLAPESSSRTTLENRFRNMEYMHDRPIASYYRFLRKGDHTENRDFRNEWRKHADFEIKLLPPDPNSPLTVQFKVQKRFGSPYNPEWRPFAGHVWEYAGPADRASLNRLLGEQRFHNLRIRYSAGDQTATLELKNLDSIVRVQVKKITEPHSSLETKKRMLGEFAPRYKEARLNSRRKAFDRRYRAYAGSLARQENRLQRNADRFDRRAAKNYEREVGRAWADTRRSMDEKEKAMDFEQWSAYCEGLADKQRDYDTRLEHGRSAMRELVLHRMGTYSCMRNFTLPNGQRIEPRFVLSDGIAVPWQTAYVFDRHFNAAVPFDRSQSGEVVLDPAGLQMIIVISDNGKAYKLNEAEVAAMNRGKVAQRIMHISELCGTATSINELRQVLGLAVQ